jgi:hypothetical protein
MSDPTRLPEHIRGDTWPGFGLAIADNQDPPAPVDLTGVSALMQVRSAVDSTTVLLARSSADGGITFPDAAGGALQVAGGRIDLPPADYYLDVQVTWSDGTVRTPGGLFVLPIVPDVTRP